MLKEFSFKQFGNLKFTEQELDENTLIKIDEHIKVLFLPKQSKIQVDFQEFQIESDSLLFLNPKVVIKPNENQVGGELLLHFNRDFYCIEIHDQEVACDGILYNNVFEIPFIQLNEEQSADIQRIIQEIQTEMKDQDSNSKMLN